MARHSRQLQNSLFRVTRSAAGSSRLHKTQSPSLFERSFTTAYRFVFECLVINWQEAGFSCNALFVRTAGFSFGELGGHIALARLPCQQPRFLCPLLPSRKPQDASLVEVESKSDLVEFLSRSIPLVTNCGGVREVYVLRMREPLTSRNKRAWNGVYFRVLQESF